MAFPNRHSRFNKCVTYKPIMVAGEAYRSMANSTELLTDTDFDQWEMSIINKKAQIVAANVGTLTKYDDNGTEFRFYWEIASFPTLPESDYRLMIWNPTTQSVKLLLNEITVLAGDYNCLSGYFQYTSTKELFNLNYEEVTNFLNSVRLNLNFTEPDNPTETVVYREVTTGESQIERADIYETWLVESELFDYYAHQAYAVALQHRFKYVNNVLLEKVEGQNYEGDKDPNSPIWNKSIRLEDVKFATINKF